jgi:hypothetical protein
MPVLATVYGLHFARGFLVERYTDMKRGGASGKGATHRLVEEVSHVCCGCVSIEGGGVGVGWGGMLRCSVATSADVT